MAVYTFMIYKIPVDTEFFKTTYFIFYLDEILVITNSGFSAY